MTWSTEDLSEECTLARSQLQRAKGATKGRKESNGFNGHTVRTEIADGEPSRPVALDGRKSKEVGTPEFAKDGTGRSRSVTRDERRSRAGSTVSDKTKTNERAVEAQSVADRTYGVVVNALQYRETKDK